MAPAASDVDKTSAGIRAMFSQIAGRYDLLNHLLSFNQDRRWRRRAISRLAPRAGQRVLDLCCGTGDLALECLRQQPRCRIVGADFAVPMLQLARRKSPPLAPASGQALAYLAGDALHLPFGDGAFDCLMVAFGVRNFEDTGRGVAEIHRVLAPGGRLMILEFMRPTSPMLAAPFGLFFRHVLPPVGRLLSRHGSAYSYLPQSVGSFYSSREFKAMLRRAGFVKVRAFSCSGGIATCFLAQRS